LAQVGLVKTLHPAVLAMGKLRSYQLFHHRAAAAEAARFQLADRVKVVTADQVAAQQRRLEQVIAAVTVQSKVMLDGFSQLQPLAAVAAQAQPLQQKMAQMASHRQ
jgi:hypothetical protein